MISCTNCGTVNQSGSLYCDECGASMKKTDSFRIHNGFDPMTSGPVTSGISPQDQGAPQVPQVPAMPQMVEPIPAYVPPAALPVETTPVQTAPQSEWQQAPEPAHHTPVNVTSFGIPPVESAPSPETVLAIQPRDAADQADDEEAAKNVHSTLTIERGSAVGKEFSLSSEETFIGRWDADNGIFPDVDLDSHDPEAKVSRRHARVLFKDGTYSVEDLGSTNGTFINRGRRLLPGNPNILNDNDELIVGKTFMRFRVKR